jgi:hypothetical protein
MYVDSGTIRGLPSAVLLDTRKGPSLQSEPGSTTMLEGVPGVAREIETFTFGLKPGIAGRTMHEEHFVIRTTMLALEEEAKGCKSNRKDGDIGATSFLIIFAVWNVNEVSIPVDVFPTQVEDLRGTNKCEEGDSKKDEMTKLKGVPNGEEEFKMMNGNPEGFLGARVGAVETFEGHPRKGRGLEGDIAKFSMKDKSRYGRVGFAIGAANVDTVKKKSMDGFIREGSKRERPTEREVAT